LRNNLTLIDSLVTCNSTPIDGGGVIIYCTLHYIDSVIFGILAEGNCIIWGGDTYQGQEEVDVENNTRVPENNCHQNKPETNSWVALSNSKELYPGNSARKSNFPEVNFFNR
jgi:hypothetical protein